MNIGFVLELKAIHLNDAIVLHEKPQCNKGGHVYECTCCARMLRIRSYTKGKTNPIFFQALCDDVSKPHNIQT